MSRRGATHFPSSPFLPRILVPILLFAATTAGANADRMRPVDYVNPLVGSDEHGHTYPGAAMPFGLVQLSPDTHTDDWDGCSGYHYRDTIIQGFSHTHLSGTGCGGLGDILIMPTVGKIHLDPGTPGNGYVSRFSHRDEVAKPGYYKTYLKDPEVTAEMTATTRVGLHRYTFANGSNAHIVIDLLHGIQNDAQETQLKAVNTTTLVGYRASTGWGGKRTVYFVIQFSKPFEAIGIENNGKRVVSGAPAATGKVKAFVTYNPHAGDSIEVKVAISATSIEGAKKNLALELPGWDFQATRKKASNSWNRVLQNVAVQSRNPHVLATFYTNLYESYQAPALFNDVDGAYWGSDHKVHSGEGFQNYTTFSLWDTYRALHPMLTILQPNRVNDLVRSLLAEYDQSNLHTTPIWPLWGNETFCMVGHHSIPVIVDAYLKGFRGFDPERAYQAMRDTVMQDGNGLSAYRTLGYVPSKRGQVGTSKTLEYAYDDWCLAKMAEKLGHRSDAALFFHRAASYRNLFDQSTGFMRGRKANGQWRTPFDTHGMVNDEYTEADAWQYAFFVQQDIPGLIKSFGGEKPFLAKLDQLFVEDSKIHTDIPDISGLIGQYSQGDEQCHHVAYLYDYAGQPWKTQARVRQVMAQLYNDTPAGQCGNVDCGQMSAWYVLSALGFYPVNPASGIYMIGSPVVDQAVITTETGKKFRITVSKNSDKNIYIQSVHLNGKLLNRLWFTHAELIRGGTLAFVMGPRPNTRLGVAPSTRPASGFPKGFLLPRLPSPSALQPAEKPYQYALPIRIAVGVEDTPSNPMSGGFLPNYLEMDGGISASRATIDTHVAGAGPAAIYQNERYGQDLTYRLHVPSSGIFTVKLHFAELFDSEIGMRREEVEINGAHVLKNFDILKEAHGLNRALVRSFSGIRPTANGEIVVHIYANPTSPDQNAKLNGLEIVRD